MLCRTMIATLYECISLALGVSPLRTTAAPSPPVLLSLCFPFCFPSTCILYQPLFLYHSVSVSTARFCLCPKFKFFPCFYLSVSKAPSVVPGFLYYRCQINYYHCASRSQISSIFTTYYISFHCIIADFFS